MISTAEIFKEDIMTPVYIGVHQSSCGSSIRSMPEPEKEKDMIPTHESTGVQARMNAIENNDKTVIETVNGNLVLQ